MWYILIGAAALVTALLTVFFLKQAKASKGTAEKAPDVLLVLGCRVKGEKAEPTLMMRIERAASYLQQNEGTEAIVCGGIVHKDQLKSEAAVMYDGLVELGVEACRITLEDKSLTTVENFLNAKKIIAEKYGNKQISLALLSSEFHLMRASTIAKRCGLNADTVAAPSPGKEKIKNYLRELLAYPLAYIDTKGVK